MFDIQRMIVKSDFSDLLNSTQEERENFGGNQLIYKQLSSCACFNIVKQVILHIFSNDSDILEQFKKDCLEVKPNSDMNEYSKYDEQDLFFTLPNV